MTAVSITLLYSPSLQTFESFPLNLTSTLLSCFSESSPAGIDQNDAGATVLTVSVAPSVLGAPSQLLWLLLQGLLLTVGAC